MLAVWSIEPSGCVGDIRIVPAGIRSNGSARKARVRAPRPGRQPGPLAAFRARRHMAMATQCPPDRTAAGPSFLDAIASELGRLQDPDAAGGSHEPP